MSDREKPTPFGDGVQPEPTAEEEMASREPPEIREPGDHRHLGADHDRLDRE